MNPKLVILCGLPGAGKSFIGRRLEQDYPELNFWPEIGGALHAELGGFPWDKDCDFDRAIMDAEFQRDERILSTKGIVVIETWHIGNLAFACLRSRAVFDVYRSRFAELAGLFRPMMLFLDVPVSLSIKRSLYPDTDAARTFLETLARNIGEMATLYKLRPVAMDASRRSEEVFEDCRHLIDDL